MRTNKIICTIGPKSANQKTLLSYFNAGMSVARLNGSHNTLDWHKETISLLKETLTDVPIMMDIPGKKIRTLFLKKEYSFAAGDLVILTADSEPAEEGRIPVSHVSLHQYLKSGDTIFADDGQLSFIVEEISNTDIKCKALVSGTLKSRKGINVPGVNLGCALITDKDREMLKFCCENKVDFVGISFVESREHINQIRIELEKHAFNKKTTPKIVAKIENLKGLDNLDPIASVADVLMIDRGDLAVETNLPSVALYQKYIIQTAQSYGVPVIVATEMLHSMVTQANPTKAEIADITNAVLDEASALMLSGETAVGDYGVESISIMAKVIETVPQFTQSNLKKTKCKTDYYNYLFRAAKDLCSNLAITKIVAFTKTGFSVRMMSSMQPLQEIICVTNDQRVARYANILYSTKGVYLNLPFEKKSTKHIEKAICWLIDNNYLSAEDFILLLYVCYPNKGNLTNSLQIHQVKDLINSLYV